MASEADGRARATATCPRPGHAGSRVKFDGTYHGDEPRIRRLEAFPNASAANCAAFLGRLGGQPPRVVCDNHSRMTSAVRALWPRTGLYLSEWHRRHGLERLLAAPARRRHGTAVAPLQPRVEAAFAGLSFWQPFVPARRTAGVPALDGWLDTNDPIIQARFRRRGFSGSRPRTMPLTTGGLEQRLRHHPPPPLRAQEPRAHQPAPDAHAAPRQRPAMRLLPKLGAVVAAAAGILAARRSKSPQEGAKPLPN